MTSIVRIPNQTSIGYSGNLLGTLQFALPLVAFGIGTIYWQFTAQYVGLGAFLALFFLMAPLNRWVAYATYAGFHLGFCIPMIAASQSFLALDAVSAYTLWIAHGLLCALPFLALRGIYPGVRAVVVFLLFVVPPFGYLAPNNPSLLVGALFPGMGWVGIVLAALMFWAATEFRWTVAKVVLGFTALCALASNAYWMSTEHTPPSNWHAGSTDLGSYADNITRRKDIANLRLPIDIGVRAYEYRGQEQIWFLAEGMIYDKEPVTDLIWRVALKQFNATAIVGEYYREKDGEMYSGVRVLGAKRDDTSDLSQSRAAITFPMSMWHPWRKDDHFPMGWPNAPIELDGQRLHLSWCAESTILWPHLRAAIVDRPNVMVSIENRWVSKGTSLEDAQTAAAQLNARFLGASLLQAINR